MNKEVEKAIQVNPAFILFVFAGILLTAVATVFFPKLVIVAFGALLGGTLTLLVAIRWPMAFVLLALLTNFMKSAYIPGLAFGEFGATPYMVSTTLAAAGLIGQILLGKRRLIVPPGFWFLSVFFVFTTLSLLIVRDFRIAIGAYARTVFDWMLFFSLVQMLNSLRRVRQLIAILLIQALIVVTWGIVAGIQLELTGAPRLSVFFWQQFQKNDFAAYLGLILVLALATFSVAESKSRKLIAIVLMAAVPVGWMFTFSRGGFLAILVCLIAFLALERNKKLLHRAFLATFFLGFLGVAIIALVPAESRTLAIDGLQSIVTGESAAERHTDTIDFRLQLVQVGIEVIASKPWLGVGFNQWQFYSPLLTQVYDPQAGEFRLTGFSIHNRYLLIAANSGLIALVGYLGFLLSVLVSAVHERRFANAWGRAYLNVFIAAALGLQVAMLFAPSVLWEWPVFGILIGISNVMKMEAKKVM